jgi:TM2 domain-containing membrane protein YozV
MIFFIRWSIILSITLLIDYCQVLGQDAKQTLQIARNFYSEGKIEEAVCAYRRVLYFENELAPEIYRDLGECYLKEKEYLKSRYYFKLAASVVSNDSIKREIWYRTVASYILEGKLVYAQNELLGIDADSAKYFQNVHAFYYGTVLYKLQDLDGAQEQFLILGANNSIEVLNLMEKAKRAYRKNRRVAMAMSVFVPGLGQTYAGDWKDGLNSLLLNAGTTTLYLYVAINYSLVDALISVMPWWHRYYVGGFTNARDMVELKKEEKLNSILNELYDQMALKNPKP